VTLDGRVCVVTGASRGLGASIADHLAGKGASLVLCARGATELEQTADVLRERHGCEIVAEAVDVADAAAVERLAEHAAERLGPAHVLVNNAGALGPIGRIDEVDQAAWRRALDVNLLGVAHAYHAFVPQMIDAGAGIVVNVLGGGVGGDGVQSFISAYTCAKAAVAVLTETTARELEPLGIRVNAISPGAIATDLMRPVLTAGPDVAGTALYETAVKIFDQEDPSPAGRTSLAPDVASLLDFLLDDRSKGITGRLFSARWDPADRLAAEAAELAGRSRYTLRRIDDELFGELAR